jgi:PKD repeat protein
MVFLNGTSLAFSDEYATEGDGRWAALVKGSVDDARVDDIGRPLVNHINIARRGDVPFPALVLSTEGGVQVVSTDGTARSSAAFGDGCVMATAATDGSWLAIASREQVRVFTMDRSYRLQEVGSVTVQGVSQAYRAETSGDHALFYSPQRNFRVELDITDPTAPAVVTAAACASLPVREDYLALSDSFSYALECADVRIGPPRIDLVGVLDGAVMFEAPDSPLDLLRLTVISVPESSESAGYDSPLSVVFTTEVVGGVPPYTYEWDFGDGGESALPNPTHEYTWDGLQPTIFRPTLTVWDAYQHSITWEGAYVLNANITPLNITLTDVVPTSGSAPLSATFLAEWEGGAPPFNVTLDTGDTLVDLGETEDQSVVVPYDYETPGTFQPVIYVADSATNADNAPFSEVVVAPPPPDYTALGFWDMEDTDCSNAVGGGLVGPCNTDYYSPDYPSWGRTLDRRAGIGYAGSTGLVASDTGAGGRVRSAKTLVARTLMQVSFGGFIRSWACGPTFSVVDTNSAVRYLILDSSQLRTSWRMYAPSATVDFGLSTDRTGLQHIALTADFETGEVTLYANGVAVSSETYTLGIPYLQTPAIRTNTNAGSYAPYSNGEFDNLFLVDGIVPQADIAKLAAGWRFNSSGILVAP